MIYYNNNLLIFQYLKLSNKLKNFMNISTTESNFENYLPHNFLAEKMVLNCILTNSEAIEVIIKTSGISLETTQE